MNSKPNVSMYDFFYEEFKTLKARTGIRQWEILNESAEPVKAINEVIDYMCQECLKFPMIRPDVQQRAIRDAIINDPDFIQLNQKFVRKALNTFWAIHGERIIQARDQQERGSRPEFNLTDEERKSIDAKANAYRAELLRVSEIKAVPHLTDEEIKNEGKEWASGLEKSQSKGYIPPSEDYVKAKELHIQYIRENYHLHTGKPLETWIPESEWLEKRKKQ